MNKKRYMVIISVMVLFAFLASVFGLTTVFQKTFANSQNPLSVKFEGKDSLKYFAYGDAKITIDQKVFKEGKKSIKVTNRKSIWGSIAVDVKGALKRGKTYAVSAYVRHDGKKPMALAISAVYDDGKGIKYTLLGEKIVMPGKWERLIGNWKYTLKDPKNVIIVVHPTVDTTSAYYVDDLAIMLSEELAAQSIVYKDSFEGGQGNWQQVGNINLKVDTSKQYDGAKSLYITGRTVFWNGVMLPIQNYVKQGRRYKFSIWVYHTSTDSQRITLLVQRKMKNEENMRYDWITTNEVFGDSWTELSGSYAVPDSGQIEFLAFYINAQSSNLSFWIDNFTISDTMKIQMPNYDLPSLKDKYQSDFKVGVAIGYGELMNSTDKQFIKKHFNSITAGNEMKPESVLRAPDTYDFTIADAFLDFAQKNNIAVRGHTLVWHNQTPDWFFKDDSGNLLKKDQLLARLKKHIYTVVGRYKGKIYAWDVVNEAIDETQPDGYRRSTWYKICGPEYIEKAFIWAHEADPNAKLYYNDYNTEVPQKRMFIYNMIKNMKAKGVPIHGVGLQCHINVDNPTVEEIEETIKLFSTIQGLEIQITELDMSFYQWGSSVYYVEPSRDMLIKQAKKYYELFNLFKKYKKVIKSVTFWGLKDDYSWLRGVFNKPDFPLLFDEYYDGKFAFWALIDYSVVPKTDALPKPPAIAIKK